MEHPTSGTHYRTTYLWQSRFSMWWQHSIWRQMTKDSVSMYLIIHQSLKPFQLAIGFHLHSSIRIIARKAMQIRSYWSNIIGFGVSRLPLSIGWCFVIPTDYSVRLRIVDISKTSSLSHESTIPAQTRECGKRACGGGEKYGPSRACGGIVASKVQEWCLTALSRRWLVRSISATNHPLKMIGRMEAF